MGGLGGAPSAIRPCQVSTNDFDAIASANTLDPATAETADLAAETRTMSRYAEFPEFIDSKDKAMGDEIAATFIHRTTRKKWHTEQAKGSGLAFLVLIEAYRAKLDADCRTGIGENVVLDIQRTIADGLDEAALQKRFEVEDEGELSDLLGIDFFVNNGVVSLTQTNYIDKLVATYAPDGVPPTFQLNATPYVLALPTFVVERP